MDVLIPVSPWVADSDYDDDDGGKSDLEVDGGSTEGHTRPMGTAVVRYGVGDGLDPYHRWRERWRYRTND